MSNTVPKHNIIFFIFIVFAISILSPLHCFPAFFLVSLSHRAAEEQRIDLSSQLVEEKQHRAITQHHLLLLEKDAAEWEKIFHQTAQEAKERQERVNSIMETLNTATQDVR